MNKTRIEWVRNLDGTQGYTWNPIKGWCPNNCPYCYAHRMYKRFHWRKEIRLDVKELNKIAKINRYSNSLRIFVGSMIDMYHPSIPKKWVDWVIDKTKEFPNHIFITLTKYPLNMALCSFPGNWWRGVTITGEEWWDSFYPEFYYPSRVKFISFEPLLQPIKKSMIKKGLDWIIIGGLTPKPVHKKEWIDDIIELADKYEIPVFVKPNAKYPVKREEFPMRV